MVAGHGAYTWWENKAVVSAWQYKKADIYKLQLLYLNYWAVTIVYYCYAASIYSIIIQMNYCTNISLLVLFSTYHSYTVVSAWQYKKADIYKRQLLYMNYWAVTICCNYCVLLLCCTYLQHNNSNELFYKYQPSCIV